MRRSILFLIYQNRNRRQLPFKVCWSQRSHFKVRFSSWNQAAQKIKQRQQPPPHCILSAGQEGKEGRGLWTGRDWILGSRSLLFISTRYCRVWGNLVTLGSISAWYANSILSAHIHIPWHLTALKEAASACLNPGRRACSKEWAQQTLVLAPSLY